jgi:hypothetical protein
MKKNSGDEILPLEVDPISGQYYITIPEWMVNELSWYEDTQIKINLDGKDVILTEHSED